MVLTLLTRVGVAVLTLAAVSLLLFFGTEALPGDAATAALGRDARPDAAEKLRTDLGLDEPVVTRYWEWLSGLAHGDLGRSLPSGDPVTDVIGDPVKNTLVLTGLTLLVLIPLVLVLGVLSAVRSDGALDHVVNSVTLSLIATPEFVIGSLLALVLAGWLGWLPGVSLVDGEAPLLGQASVFVLPVLTLLAASVAQGIRMVRACMLDVLRSEYVETARLKGVPEWRVLAVHALPNALGPTLQVLAITAAWLTGGVVVVEAVFSFSGLGQALTGAVASRDVPTVQAIALLIAFVYITVNVLADVGNLLLNPRLRRGSSA